MSRSIAQPLAAGDARGHALVTLDGRYHVVERIAAGGMGEVYLAHDAVLAREVAIKVLHRSLAGDAGFVERFRREARAAATLNHPHIVAVYDWGAVDGIYYMVMEFVRGRSVRELLNANGKLAPAQAAEIVGQTLDALAHAHARGIVHRDLKPENILLTTDGVVKLTDLGLARAFGDAKATHAGAVTGTVQYLAPEQIRGEPADPRSDLYSLGIVTFELLTGRLPFSGETPMAIAYKHLSDAVPAPSGFADDVPPDLDAFVAAAVDKDREMRPESATVMRTDLAAIAARLPRARSLGAVARDVPEIVRDGDVTAALPPIAVTQTIPRLERAKRRRWRRAAAWLMALVVLATAAWGTWTYVIPHTSPVPPIEGLSVDEATTRLRAQGFSVRLADGRFDEREPAGTVLDVRPDSGTELEEGAAVTLVPSLGPPPIDLPVVVGMPVEDARGMLTDAGFDVDVKRRFHDTVPEGDVIAQSPRTPQATKGSTVVLTVSDGHAPVPVPAVVGKPQEKAEAALRDAGFRPIVLTAFSDDVARGDVISVNPEVGTTQDFGSGVTITVSKGPESFPTPNFSGLSKSAAEALADRSGLQLRFVYLPNTPQAIVYTQAPAAGTTITYGGTVTLWLG
ncbi:MAG TPA: Stk1 family PASTA domain-containing Ser/Thr kinase [Actinomycetota bacterium]